MRAKPVKLIEGQWVGASKDEGTHLHLIFPLDIVVHIDIDPPMSYNILRDRYIPYQLNGSREHTGNWSWNGDTEHPTLRPSILSTYNQGEVIHQCHSFVNDGKIQFLQDCTHDLVGQTVDLLHID
jgi:hypothetical protein